MKLTDEPRETPLHNASSGDSLEIVELLVEHGADLADTNVSFNLSLKK